MIFQPRPSPRLGGTIGAEQHRGAVEALAILNEAMGDVACIDWPDDARTYIACTAAALEGQSGTFRFQVRRTSQYGDETPPCEEATRGMTAVWDVRTFKSPEEHDAKLHPEKWHARGTEHQIVYGPRGGARGIKRRMPDREAWFVEFETLSDLMAFWEKYGDLVITESLDDKESPMVEIYDGYRE